MRANEEGNNTPSNVTAARPIQKRKRESGGSRVVSNKSARTSTPNAYARRSPPPARRTDKDEDDKRRSKAREPSHSRSRSPSPVRQLKRPGGGARISRDQAEAARRQREEAERSNLASRTATGAELVAEHYNAVPERGREWRKTDSQIKGLRSLNNWIKSTLIQKFSRPDIPPQDGLKVLDMACGKGGDLGKWEKAPTVPALYVGCDIAEVSIEQARGRYSENMRKGGGRGARGGGRGGYGRPPPMDAHFFVQDTFGQPLSNIPIVRQVGFNPNAGPGPSIIQGGMMSGGFDVVSMMFALHYSFESETLARGMLKNVAGALKKGGRFIGVMPDSDVISATVKRLLQAEGLGATPGNKSGSQSVNHGNGDANGAQEADQEDDWDPEKPADGNGEAGDEDWDPEKPSDAVTEPVSNGQTTTTDGAGDEEWDPEKPAEPTPTINAHTNGDKSTNGSHEQPNSIPIHEGSIEWGNSIYAVRFPRHQPLTSRPLPKDGIFRPPYGWKYHYSLEEAVNAPEFVVPWEGFRALAEDYGLELLYRKGFREVFEDESEDRELGQLAERMGVMSRDRSEGRGGLLVREEEMEAAAFYHAFCFYKT
ncbi:mRNA cap guanine-N7 methyltransferase [Recurvomyces mirabilis]|uniref:mRNA cap guanine-N(7) methyltransferase n=1 Tax=Recurvomyces mirabilis TaxID=574656 RepID=A0AAE0WV36_9PEZI|nr:mRNA cap guanine-N7 methyltransferase [Recurvomyces mirabilis]KAK5156777.1 mRNA cap guanine-N7 methyltransferase [Recurvomyces mirabilis]